MDQLDLNDALDYRQNMEAVQQGSGEERRNGDVDSIAIPQQATRTKMVSLGQTID